MIRINLLRSQAAAPGVSLPRRLSSAFISRREVVIGGAFLLIGIVILYFQIRRPAHERPARPGAELIAPLSRAAERDRSIEMDEPPEPTPEQKRWFQERQRSKGRDQGGRRETSPVSRRQEADAEGPNLAATQDGPVSPDGALGDLQRLNLNRGRDSLHLTLETTHQPRFNTFRVTDPDRVVLDLMDTRVTIPADQRNVTVLHAGVSRIRIGQFAETPPRARLVFEVTSFQELEIEPSSQGLEIFVGNRSE